MTEHRVLSVTGHNPYARRRRASFSRTFFGALAALTLGFSATLSEAAFASEVQSQRPPSHVALSVNPTWWVGFAVSPGGRVFHSAIGLREGDARQFAKTECEEETGRTCRAIAVPNDWNVTAVRCDGTPLLRECRRDPPHRWPKARPKTEGVYSCRKIFEY